MITYAIHAMRFAVAVLAAASLSALPACSPRTGDDGAPVGERQDESAPAGDGNSNAGEREAVRGQGTASQPEPVARTAAHQTGTSKSFEPMGADEAVNTYIRMSLNLGDKSVDWPSFVSDSIPQRFCVDDNLAYRIKEGGDAGDEPAETGDIEVSRCELVASTENMSMYAIEGTGVANGPEGAAKLSFSGTIAVEPSGGKLMYCKLTTSPA